MNGTRRGTSPVVLAGLDGANPLGFLAAVGTLVALHAAGETSTRLRWRQDAKWTPVLEGVPDSDPEGLSEIVAGALRGRSAPPNVANKAERAQQRFDTLGTAIKNKQKEIKSRRLDRNANRQAIAREIGPIEERRERRRRLWLLRLARAAPRTELALGKRLDCRPEEFRERALALVEAGPAERDALALLTAFGSDACLAERDGTIQPTPFQFITGSGHQYFLETVRKLMEEVSPQRVRDALFHAWEYADDGLSMRWDPVEDRRYALMDRDPTASDNKPRTVWMANLLGYRALALFPSSPRKAGLRTVAWAESEGGPIFTWPLWEHPVGPDTVRSLLALRELAEPRPDHALLRARGVAVVFRARKTRFPPTGMNYKLNFSPARAV
ncbi:hypothetical protein BH24GEM3_BH24GEM3_02450 [soil metagenome]|jgi:hypothetical protein